MTEETRLDREMVKIEEKKQVAYSYKKLKLQHHLIDGKTENIYVGSYSSEMFRFSPDEAKMMMTILNEIFGDE